MNATLAFVLRSAIPYTRENYLLSQWPSRFFDELQESGISRRDYQKSYSYAKKKHLVATNGEGLTKSGYRRLFTHALREKRHEVLAAHKDLLVVFDIPETHRYARNHLRKSLRDLGFRRIQRSVWLGSSCAKDEVATVVRLLSVETHVEEIRIR